MAGVFAYAYKKVQINLVLVASLAHPPPAMNKKLLPSHITSREDINLLCVWERKRYGGHLVVITAESGATIWQSGLLDTNREAVELSLALVDELNLGEES